VIDQNTFDEVHERAWAALAEPGDWLEALERRELVRAVRASAECAVCDARAGAASPLMAGVEHAPGALLPAPLVDVAHRVARDNARLGRAWAEGVIAELGAGPYAEAVGITASVRVMDTFRRCTGRKPAPPREPRPGEPPRQIPEGVGDVGAWVPQSLHKTRANVTRALSCVPRTDAHVWRPLVDIHYSRGAEFASLTWDRALARPQVELIAATVTSLNECFY
jgi:hypothetical protein